ncbi:hypothetical protein SLA2020_480810 [Shorea laevis]
MGGSAKASFHWSTSEVRNKGVIMETTSKVLLVSAILLLALASAAEGGRKLKDEAEHPQNINFAMGSGTFFPSPAGLGYRPGPVVFCSFFPGNGCVPVGPTIPGESTGSTPFTPLTPPFTSLTPPFTSLTPPFAPLTPP